MTGTQTGRNEERHVEQGSGDGAVGKKREAVSALPGPKRYSHFIKVAADQRRAWGVFLDGWAKAGTDEGQHAFPLWPAAEYALDNAVEEWAGYEPREIDLDTLFDVLLPRLREAGDLVAVFPTALRKGVFAELSVLEEDLRRELARVE